MNTDSSAPDSGAKPRPKWYSDPTLHPTSYRVSAKSRFLRAAIVAAGIFFALGSLYRSTSLFRWLGLWDHPQEASSIFHLPFNDTSALFFHVIGPGGSGRITFLPGHPDQNLTDHVSVETTVTWRGQSDPSDPVGLGKRQRSDGWGMVFRGGSGRFDRRFFNVRVTLPVTGANELLRFGTLETDLPNFAHGFDALKAAVSFDVVQLRAANAHVRAQSLTARSVDVRTSNAGISGSFNVTDDLVLHTSNGAIDVSISALNGDWEDPTSIDLQTSNAHIHATASFLSAGTKEAERPTGFHMRTESSNGYTDVKIPTAPVDSYITYSGKTSNARAWLQLPPAFEGTIEGRTSSYTKAEFVWNEETPDPSGRKRKRAMEAWTPGRGWFDVRTSWGFQDDHFSRGNATITTSNAHVAAMIA